MKRTLFILIVIFSAGNLRLHAQFQNRIHVRESFTDVNTVDAGVQFASVYRNKRLDGGAFHGGLKLDLINPKSEYSPGLSIGPTVELHRNVNGKAKELTFMVGANAIGLYGDPKDFGQRLLLTAEYKNNRVARREGSQVTLRYSMESAAVGLGEPVGPDSLGFAWQPVVGVEWENRARVAQGEQTGRTVRGYASMKVSLYPGKAVLDKRIEWSGSYAIWSDFFETSRIIDHDDDHQMIKTSITVYLDKTRHFGLSGDYVRGEDPTKSMSFQEFGGFSIRVRF